MMSEYRYSPITCKVYKGEKMMTVTGLFDELQKLEAEVERLKGEPLEEGFSLEARVRHYTSNELRSIATDMEK